MKTVSNIRKHSKDLSKVREFFAQWNLYRKVIGFNYMAHKEISLTLHDFITSNCKHPFSVLDLGCGDAHVSSMALKDSPVAKYHGVDLSDIAIDFAAENMESYSCEKSFIVGDFMDILDNYEKEFDIIVAGYSIHHFPFEEKGVVLKKCRDSLKPGGSLLIYDILRKNSETRTDYCNRAYDFCKRNWSGLTIDEIETVFTHVNTNDYPESRESIEELAVHNGFGKIRELFRDKSELYIFFHLPY